MGFKFEEKNVSLKCTECGQDYEDTQIIVNGVPSCKFHICPECKRKFEKVFCIWRILTAGFAEQNGRNAKLNGRITFDY